MPLHLISPTWYCSVDWLVHPPGRTEWCPGVLCRCHHQRVCHPLSPHLGPAPGRRLVHVPLAAGREPMTRCGCSSPCVPLDGSCGMCEGGTAEPRAGPARHQIRESAVTSWWAGAVEIHWGGARGVLVRLERGSAPPHCAPAAHHSHEVRAHRSRRSLWEWRFRTFWPRTPGG
jgi:hypothetical protein